MSDCLFYFILELFYSIGELLILFFVFPDLSIVLLDPVFVGGVDLELVIPQVFVVFLKFVKLLLPRGITMINIYMARSLSWSRMTWTFNSTFCALIFSSLERFGL